MNKVALLIFSLCFLALEPCAQNLDTGDIKRTLDRCFEIQLSNPELARSLAFKALDQSEKIDFEWGIADASMRLGYMHYVQAHYDSALYYLKTAYEKRMAIKDVEGAISASLLVSYCQQQTGKKDSAFMILFESLALCDKYNYISSRASVQLALANMYFSYNELNLSLKYALESEKTYKELNIPSSIAVALSTVGTAYYGLDQYQKALNYFNASDSIFNKGEDAYANARNMNNIALCHDALSQSGLARIYYEKAKTVYIALNMQIELSMVYNNIGVVYENEQNLDSAISYYKQGLEVARKIGAKEHQLNSLEFLADAYRQTGNYQKAFLYQMQYSTLNDSLIDNEKVKQIAEMQTKYETDKKVQENRLLSLQNKAKSTERNFFIIASVLLLLGLLVLAAYYVQRNKVALRNKEIAQTKIEGLLNEQEIATYKGMIEGQDEERKRIAKDLHDRVGSMLSTVKMLFNALDSSIAIAGEDNINQFKKTNKVLDEAVNEVRQVSHNLSTGMVTSFGLISALEELCNTVNSSKLVSCKLLLYGIEDRFNQQVEIGIYRMVQEILNNVLKHAKAKNINIIINKTPDTFNISIEDDGVGFDLESIKKSKKRGIGLSNLETRAATMNGTYTIDSQPGRGAISIIDLPINALES